MEGIAGRLTREDSTDRWRNRNMIDKISARGQPKAHFIKLVRPLTRAIYQLSDVMVAGNCSIRK